MRRIDIFTRTVGISALLALSTVPAYADPGKADRAHAAIAEARGKIDAGERVGTSAEAPELRARARASLASAEALLERGKKDEAIIEARHASEFADMAIVTADKHKEALAARDRMDAEASADRARQAAANANARAEDAQQVAVAATADANDRVDAAQQAAAAANAQAEALRNAPPPAPTVTVATVERTTVHTPARRVVRAKRRVVHHVVRKPAAVPAKTTVTTTTTLTTKPR